MRSIVYFLLLSSLGFATKLRADSWYVRQVREGDRISILSVEQIGKMIAEESIVHRSLPYLLDEGPLSSVAVYEEVAFKAKNLPPEYLRFKAVDPIKPSKNSELRILVEQGPWQNRINLTIIGDGYTQTEREKFFSDAE